MDPVFAGGLVVAYVLLVLLLCGLAAVMVRLGSAGSGDSDIRPVPLPTMTVLAPGATVPVSIEGKRVVMQRGVCA